MDDITMDAVYHMRIKSVKHDGPPPTIEGLSAPCLCFRESGRIALCYYCDGANGNQKIWIDNSAMLHISYSDITHYAEIDIENMWNEIIFLHQGNDKQRIRIQTELEP